MLDRGTRCATPISLDDYRERKLERVAGPFIIGHLACAPGEVLIRITDGTEIPLTPAQARVWAERLAYFADTAEQLTKDADFVVDPDGGRRG
jgi:hypothetical protein